MMCNRRSDTNTVGNPSNPIGTHDYRQPIGFELLENDYTQGARCLQAG
jgi:hypothetical protein